MHDKNISQIKVFIAVVQSNGFSGAQALLNISASTISEHMSNLETRLGMKLCHRGRAGFRLTNRGKQVYESSQRLLSALECFRQETGKIKHVLNGELRIGIIGNTITDNSSPFKKALEAFTKRPGDVKISLDIGSPIELEQKLLDGRIHIAIGTFPFKVHGLKYTPLYSEHEGLFCSQHHKLSKIAKEVDIEKLTDFEIVVRGYMNKEDLKLLNTKKVSASVENVEAQAYLILTGKYIGYLPIHFAEYWVKRKELIQLAPNHVKSTLPYDYVIRENSYLNYVLGIFIDDLDKVINK